MSILNKLTIKAKLSLLIALSALSLVIALGIAASFQYQSMMTERLAKLRGIVETAHGLAQSLDADTKAGHITHDEAIQRFRRAIYSMWYDNHSNYLIAFTMDGTSIVNAADPKQEGTNRSAVNDINGKPIVGSMIEAMRRQDEATVTYVYPKPGQTEPLQKLTFVKRFEPWGGFLATGVYTDDIDTAYRSVLIHLAITALCLIAATAGSVFLISRNITNSLASLKAKMENVAAGDLTVAITEANRADEIGAMAKTVQVFKDNAQAMRQLQDDQETLKQQADQEKKQAIAALADSFEARIRGIVDVLSTAATQMQSAARSMSATADSTRQQSAAVASAADLATANVQTVAAASEELSASIAEIGRQVQQASGVSRKAADEGQRTNSTVAGLAEAAQKIGDVVSLINHIAGQTNLLALNATIEAARAGEAGKGFAVVASEVKSLASQTAKATDDIRAQINAIQTETRSAVGAIQGISKTILEVNEISSSIAAAVEQQSAATREITRNVQQAAGGTQEVSHNIAGVSEAVDKAGSSATDVLTAADRLAEQAQVLREEVDQFLATVRAA